MNLAFALTLAILVACGLYMMQRRSLVKMLVGFGLLGHAVNLLVFSSGGIGSHHPPIVEQGARALERGVVADPLPQALVLTAIVIGFGAQVFLLVLLRGLWLSRQKNDTHDWVEEA